MANNSPRPRTLMNGSANGHCTTDEATSGNNGNGRYGNGKTLPPLWELVVDPANACTLVGSMCGMLALVNVWNENYILGNLLNMGANLADLVDGPIARSMIGRRHPVLPHLGISLDAFSDLVSHFVVPACMLIKLSGVHPVCACVGIAWVLAGIIRLSFVTFIEYGKMASSSGGATALDGITSDFMNAFCAMCFHLICCWSDDNVCIALCIITLFMTYGCLTDSLRTLRYSGLDLVGVVAFNVSLTLSCFVLWLDQSFHVPLGGATFSIVSLGIHLVLLYPTYLRFVKFNKT